MPAILTRLRVFEAILDLVAVAGLDRMAPTIDRGLDVVRMHAVSPAPVPLCPVTRARVGQGAAVVIIDMSVGVRRPDDLRHRLGKLAEPRLTFPQSLFSVL